MLKAVLLAVLYITAFVLKAAFKIIMKEERH
jgi:hypothetical protein